ncbi:hypothetical protein [Alkaliphilus sp. B6464]|uniref:hypothetical protein n=1 Tax=Alkaliphilus sp. B6464 TaxID=2731219 RepID=UPI001BA65752|nr:hypothetical protein [Alkaliphilus sp. B6464]QUH21968.1 hypothetical protein HYG84_18865 [Alkaliphilus sp. B6464]
MAKEPSLDFLKSISKFKRNTLNKKSGTYNYKSRLKLIDDFLITKQEIETGKYEKTLKENNSDEVISQIHHRIERYRFFVNSLPTEVKIPKKLHDSFDNKNDIYKYFINFRRKNKICFSLPKKVDELELEIAMKIIDNFYIIDIMEYDKELVKFKKITFEY